MDWKEPTDEERKEEPDLIKYLDDGKIHVAVYSVEDLKDPKGFKGVMVRASTVVDGNTFYMSNMLAKIAVESARINLIDYEANKILILIKRKLAPPQ